MNEGFNVIAQGDTRFGIMAVERMESVKDTSVHHGLVGGPSGRRFRDDGCFINQHLLIGGIQRVKTSNHGLGLKRRGPRSFVF